MRMRRAILDRNSLGSSLEWVKAMFGQGEQVRRRISLTDRKKDCLKARLQSHRLKGNVVGFKDFLSAF